MFLPKSIRARFAGALLCSAVLASVTGCTATVTTTPVRSAVVYDHAVVYVDDAPYGVYESPVAYYRGRPAYLVGARWYYRMNDGWVYFNDEPVELRRARTTHTFVRIDSDAPHRRYVERRPVRRRYVEHPTETRRRTYD